MAGADLIVNDEHIALLGIDIDSKIGDGASSIETKIKNYITELKQTRNNAILSGATADTIDAIIGFAESLQKIAADINTDIQANIKGFLQALDDADQFSS